MDETMTTNAVNHINLNALCDQVIAHPFVDAILDDTNGDASAMLNEAIQETMANNYGGDELRVYIPKRPANMRHRRNSLMRKMFSGGNVKQVAKRFNVSIKTAQRVCYKKSVKSLRKGGV
jgi:Mor family transcriptional regulator